MTGPITFHQKPTSCAPTESSIVHITQETQSSYCVQEMDTAEEGPQEDMHDMFSSRHTCGELTLLARPIWPVHLGREKWVCLCKTNSDGFLFIPIFQATQVPHRGVLRST